MIIYPVAIFHFLSTIFSFTWIQFSNQLYNQLYIFWIYQLAHTSIFVVDNISLQYVNLQCFNLLEMREHLSNATQKDCKKR